MVVNSLEMHHIVTAHRELRELLGLAVAGWGKVTFCCRHSVHAFTLVLSPAGDRPVLMLPECDIGLVCDKSRRRGMSLVLHKLLGVELTWSPTKSLGNSTSALIFANNGLDTFLTPYRTSFPRSDFHLSTSARRMGRTALRVSAVRTVLSYWPEFCQIRTIVTLDRHVVAYTLRWSRYHN